MYSSQKAHAKVKEAVDDIEQGTQYPQYPTQTPSDAAQVLEDMVDSKGLRSSGRATNPYEERVYRSIRDFLDERLSADDLRIDVENSLKHVDGHAVDSSADRMD